MACFKTDKLLGQLEAEMNHTKKSKTYQQEALSNLETAKTLFREQGNYKDEQDCAQKMLLIDLNALL